MIVTDMAVNAGKGKDESTGFTLFGLRVFKFGGEPALGDEGGKVDTIEPGHVFTNDHASEAGRTTGRKGQGGHAEGSDDVTPRKADQQDGQLTVKGKDAKQVRSGQPQINIQSAEMEKYRVNSGGSVKSGSSGQRGTSTQPEHNADGQGKSENNYGVFGQFL